MLSDVMLKAPILMADLLRSRGVQPHLAILIYHQVLTRPDPLMPGTVIRDQFEQQMALLRAHFQPISLLDGVQRMKEGTLTPRCVCVTFDDGYADNLTVAAPVLSKYGIPATVFVAPGFLDGGIMWNDRVIGAVRHTKLSAVDGSPFGTGSIPLNTVPEKLKAIKMLLAYIKHRSMKERAALVDELERSLKARQTESTMLTTKQLRALLQLGIDIGAHTLNHPILACETDATAKTEIGESKVKLETVLQQTVKLFAYPNGRRGQDYEQRHVEMVRQAGFSAAFSTDNGLNRMEGDEMQLRRFTPWDSSSLKFGLRLLANEYRA